MHQDKTHAHARQTLNYAPATASGATTALATTSATLAGCVGRLTRTAATASAAATNGEPGDAATRREIEDLQNSAPRPKDTRPELLGVRG